MTTRWTQCTKCKVTKQIALDVALEDWECEDCREPGYREKKVWKQPLPDLRRKERRRY